MTKLKKQKLSSDKHLKEPKVDTSTADDQHPLFSFRFLQSKFGIETCNLEQTKGFIKQLNNVSQLTWGKWKLSSRQGNGYEIIERKSLKTSVPAQISDDVKFISFRFHNGRCVGYRNETMFYVVWIDGSLKLYNH